MKRDIIFDMEEVGKIKGRIFVKQHSSASFAAMVILEYPENLDPRLKELFDCAQCPQIRRIYPMNPRQNFEEVCKTFKFCDGYIVGKL